MIETFLAWIVSCCLVLNMFEWDEQDGTSLNEYCQQGTLWGSECTDAILCTEFGETYDIRDSRHPPECPFLLFSWFTYRQLNKPYKHVVCSFAFISAFILKGEEYLGVKHITRCGRTPKTIRKDVLQRNDVYCLISKFTFKLEENLTEELTHSCSVYSPNWLKENAIMKSMAL